MLHSKTRRNSVPATDHTSRQSRTGHRLMFLRMPGVNRQGQAHIVSTAIVSPGSGKGSREVEATPWFRTWFSIDPQPASISPTINISIVFICAFLIDCGRTIRIRQSKAILARSLGAGRSCTVSADDDLRRKFRDVRGSRQRGLKRTIKSRLRR
jgi:hypothetical protein